MKSSKKDVWETIQLLGKVNTTFGKEAALQKEILITKIRDASLDETKSLILHHQALLFLLAYPENRKLHDIAREELNRVSAAAKKIFAGRNEQSKTRLTNTGIANTRLNVSFGLHLSKWLVQAFPNHIDIYSCDADEDTLRSVFTTVFTKPEGDRLKEKSLTFSEIIQEFRKSEGISDLIWLLQLMNDNALSYEVRDHLYDSLKIYLSISLDESTFSVTHARSLPRKIFFHQNGLLKKFNPDRAIRKPLGQSTPLNGYARNLLVVAARGILCSHQRETDPVTYANERETELFDMGRGVDIALFPMIPEKRLSLESYIGYVAFKNRLPVAYGGGWVFLHRCKIGTNIFPAFRGGESSWIFSQILRLYHHRYTIKKFIVEPYQIGKGNSEGLRSGAYWFYHRLGFRSVKKELQEVAKNEFRQIASNRNYRTPLSELKKFTTANLELNLQKENSFPDFNPELLSDSITDLINRKYGGDRKEAVLRSSAQLMKENPESKKWFEKENGNFRQMVLITDLIKDFHKKSKRDQMNLLKLFRIKDEGDERDFILRLQSNPSLIKMLESAISDQDVN